MERKIVNPQAYAITFEHIIRSVFDCERFGAFGIADADYIRSKPLCAVIATCTYVYAKDETKADLIKKFLDEANFYFRFDFDTLLSFETNEKEINGSFYTLDYKNGAEAIKELEKQFRGICKL